MRIISTVISVIALVVSIWTLIYVKSNEPVVLDLFTLINEHKIKIYDNAISNRKIDSVGNEIAVMTNAIEKILSEYKEPVLLRQAVVGGSYRDITPEVGRKLTEALKKQEKK